MIITPAKEDLIQNDFIETSFPNKELSRAKRNFKKLNTWDQFYLASIYNWDDGVEILNWIITSKKCAKATASLIFWSSDPDYYLNNKKQLRPEDEKVKDLLLNIIEKFKSNSFNWNLISFRLTSFSLESNVPENIQDWNLPEELIKPIKGLPIISLGIIQNKIWNYQRKKRLQKREKKKAQRKKSA